MSEEPKTYDASVIQVLEGAEAVRRRPGMYIGSVGRRGLHHLVLDAVEPALEAILHGTAHRVEITLLADGGFRVADDGAGLPVERAGHSDGTPLERRLTALLCGVQPATRRPLYGSDAGVGLAVVNALSERLTVEVRRDGARWVLEYERGAEAATPVRTGPADGSGTTFTVRPDASIFETVEFSFEELAERFRELAFLNRELDITLTDERDPAAPRSVRLRFPGGPRDHLAELCASRRTDVIWLEREYAAMEGTVEVALCWSDSSGFGSSGSVSDADSVADADSVSDPDSDADSSDGWVASYANSRPTRGGGTHELGFREGLAAALTACARERQLLTATDPDLTPDRLGAGLTAVVSVKLDRPELLGAIHDVLGNAPARACVAEAVREHLSTWLRANPEQAAAVLARIPMTAHP